MPRTVKGWIYIIVNPAMPDLIKVGFSTKDPTLRAEELGHTGTPHAYEVVYDALVFNPHEKEQIVHGILNSCREGKEWFRTSVFRAKKVIQEVAGGEILHETSAKTRTEDPNNDPATENTDTLISRVFKLIYEKRFDEAYRLNREFLEKNPSHGVAQKQRDQIKAHYRGECWRPPR